MRSQTVMSRLGRGWRAKGLALRRRAKAALAFRPCVARARAPDGGGRPRRAGRPHGPGAAGSAQSRSATSRLTRSATSVQAAPESR
jgi:hypothetical protein